MSNNNPYYTQQQMRQQSPYVDSQQPPYFSNQQPYNNPPPQYPPYHRPQPSANIMIVQVPANHIPPNVTQCRFCRQLTPTYMQLRSGVFVWLMCLVIMMLTCCCWWIAFWVDSWKDQVFRCQRCNNVKHVKQGGFF